MLKLIIVLFIIILIIIIITDTLYLITRINVGSLRFCKTFDMLHLHTSLGPVLKVCCEDAALQVRFGSKPHFTESVSLLKVQFVRKVDC